MTLLARKKQFALKQETTEGTAETLAAADVKMEVEDLQGNFTPEMQERNPLRADLGRSASVVGITMGEITGKTELVPGAPAATTDPNVHRLLLALGFQQHPARTGTLAAPPTGTPLAGEYITGNIGGTGFFISASGTSLTFVQLTAFNIGEVVTGSQSGFTATMHATAPNFTDLGKAYRPNSATPPAFTSAVMHDGKRIQIFGSRGDGSIEVGGAGQIGYLNFTLNGAAVQPVDAALFSGVSVPVTIPETFLNASLKAGGVELCVDAFTLALGNTVARRTCSNALTGIKSYRMTARQPRITIEPEQELESVINFFGKFAAGTLFDFFAVIGTTVGKRVIIVASRAQYAELGQGDREGISTHPAQIALTRGLAPGGDDEFLIVFA
jgi:hypothetical protein